MTGVAAIFRACPVAGRRRPLASLLILALGLAGIGKLALLLGQIVGNTAPGLAPPMHLARIAPAAEEETSLPEPAAGPSPTGSPGDPAEASPGPEAPAGPEPDTDAAPPLDPARMTSSEIQVLRQLAARRAELEAHADRLELREALVDTAEARLLEQAKRLSRLRAEIEALVEQADQKEQARLGNLVKIYEAMKPKAAAEIFNRLEMPVLIRVVERMREAKSADVLARMDPVKARQVTAELARRGQLASPAEDETQEADGPG
jgi:flagellar motility protein MotE (MotC chaperone)